MSSKNKPAKDKRYTVAIIGCGGIGFSYDKGTGKIPRTHFSAFNASPFFKVESVIEPDEKTRAYIGKNFGVRTYERYSAWAKAERPDVIVIASPDTTHEALLTSLLKIRPKIVFCEKPLLTDQTKIGAMVRKYKKHRIALMVNYSRRFMPEYQAVKRLLRKKVFGKIQLVTILYSRGFIHNGSHYIDLIHWFFGAPTKIIKETRRKGALHDDTYACTFLYASGTEIRLLGIDASPLTVNEMDIIGDMGRLQIDTQGNMSTYAVDTSAEFPSFTFFVPTGRKHISYAGALGHAVENIAQYLKRSSVLLSPAEYDIKNASLLSRVKKMTCLN